MRRQATIWRIAAFIALGIGAGCGNERGEKPVGTAPTSSKEPVAQEAPKPADGWIDLFNGKDLAGWTLRDPNHHNSWSVKDGILTNVPHAEKHGVDIYSDAMFDDFELHVEFKVPKDSNSGVYLRGRYEVQINSYDGKLDGGSMGAIYGQHTPSEAASLPWDQWQTYDVTLVGRNVTVKLNGKTVIDNVKLTGITGGVMDQFRDETKPGPIMLQGDHGVVMFRCVRIKPLDKVAP